ncbi:MAG: hypothetical protein ACF787_08965, partial [Rhodopirellula sp. JB053]
IASLASTFESAASPIEWLIITHNDPQLLRSLASAFEEESVAFLPISQDSWDSDDVDLEEAIAWAMRQTKITNLLLVGDSQAAAEPSTFKSRWGSEQESGGYARLLAGAQRKCADDRRAREELAGHIDRLRAMPVVRERLLCGVLAVNGLYYRCESGLFLAYDSDAERFEPLLVT